MCFLNRTHSKCVSSTEHITKTESEPAYEYVSLKKRQRQTREDARESKGTLKDNRIHDMKTWRRGKMGPKRERKSQRRERKSQRRERNSPKREIVRRAREGREGGGWWIQMDNVSATPTSTTPPPPPPPPTHRDRYPDPPAKQSNLCQPAYWIHQICFWLPHTHQNARRVPVWRLAPLPPRLCVSHVGMSRAVNTNTAFHKYK